MGNDSIVDPPETRYAKTADGVHIGYQVVGQGATDLVLVPWDYWNIEAGWDLPQFRTFVQALADHARVLLLDRRGVGTSDRGGGENATMEARMDDVRAVMDAAGSQRAWLFGVESAAGLCFLFAASYPERTAGLITLAPVVRGMWAPDYPWAWRHHQWQEWLKHVEQEWGSRTFVRELAEWISPSLAGDPDFLRILGRILRLSASPGEAVARDGMIRDTDVRHVLPTIQVPTLVLHRSGDRVEPVEQGRYVAEHVADSRFVLLPGEDHIFPFDDVVEDIVGFIASIGAEEAEFDRVLATVLFTDIVDSTAKAARVGDRVWRDLVERHHATVRALLGRYRGVEVDTAGDGFLATFDGPVRAVRCAMKVTESVRSLDLEIRAGVHTGEVEIIDRKVGGISVIVGARVAACAGASQVFVSQTVKDLVAGSGLRFTDEGSRGLKGVPGSWQLHRVLQG